jgi:hypothetical protein
VADQPPINISVHGPYEDAMIAGFELLGKVVDKQDPATAKELWTRWLDATKGWSDLGAAMSKGLSDALAKLISLKGGSA